MTTKQQEREALEKIREIVAALGENSYAGTAFKGVFNIAEQNIDCDAAFSLADELADAKEDTEAANQYMKVYVPAMITLSQSKDNLSGMEKWQKELQACVASWQRVNHPRTPLLTVIGDLQFIAERARYVEAQALQIPFARRIHKVS